MESNIVEIKKNDVQLFNASQVELMKRTIAQGATDDELSLFINQCKRTGLDPFTRQIYFIKDKAGKVTVCSSIDGLRLVAERSDKYEGQTKTEWCDDKGVWTDIWLDTKKLPAAARVGVFKTKFREPTYGVAVFDEYAGRKADGSLTFMWNKMPALMIGKVAEALALRKAFPNDLSGIYSTEEAELIEATPTDAKQVEPKKFTPTPKAEVAIEPKFEPQTSPADYVVTFGKFKDLPLKDLKLQEIESYITFLENGAAKSNKPLTGGPFAFVKNAKLFLASQVTDPTDLPDIEMKF